MLEPGPIGIFDSGYGGLTILSEFQKILPQYDYCYLGDNSRAPYGSRSFDVIYEFTRESVETLFTKGCNLVILACNTASAKALRSIQQLDLPRIAPDKRVLGIIRPTAEIIGRISKSKHVGVLGTIGTVQSNSYTLEIEKLFPEIKVTNQACPMWVPLVENSEYNQPGADYFVKQYIDQILEKDSEIDTLILGCTHYPLLLSKIKQYLPEHIQIISQGEYVAKSLQNYLNRHPEIDKVCTKQGITHYFTTEAPSKFADMAKNFLNQEITVQRIALG